MSNATDPLRVAVVGLRIHAGGLDPDRDHGLIKSFYGRDDARIVAYCEWDPDESAALESLAKYDPSAQIYTSLEELLDREAFEVAVVMLPPNEATPASEKLAQAGKHLFIEKQAARTAPELLPLLELAAQRNLVVRIGYPWPSHPVAHEIRRCLDGGVLGKLLAMEARLVTVQIAPGLREPDHWMYRLETEGGGILHMEGGHWLALFQMFAQARVRSVTALCSRRTDVSQEGVEDAATVALEYANGVHACLHMGYLLTAAGPRNDTYMAVRGDLGAATWDDVGSGTLVVNSAAHQWQGAPQRTFNMPPAPRAVYAEQWGYNYVSEFLKAVREGGRALVSIEDGHHFLQIFDAAYESSRTGRRIEL
ncbi:MAG: Gfo/Idh/MocA family oxidoreductase [Caldilineaceae bacterium]|nr:Gfo/Idh/MocA family oxidoreductase [Caldilineaceae bacterium]